MGNCSSVRTTTQPITQKAVPETMFTASRTSCRAVLDMLTAVLGFLLTLTGNFSIGLGRSGVYSPQIEYLMALVGPGTVMVLAPLRPTDAAGVRVSAVFFFIFYAGDAFFHYVRLPQVMFDYCTHASRLACYAQTIRNILGALLGTAVMLVSSWTIYAAFCKGLTRLALLTLWRLQTAFLLGVSAIVVTCAPVVAAGDADYASSTDYHAFLASVSVWSLSAVPAFFLPYNRKSSLGASLSLV